MKRLITALIFLVPAILSYGQNVPAPVAAEKGMVLEYKTTTGEGAEMLSKREVVYVKDEGNRKIVGIKDIGTPLEGMSQEQFDRLSTTEYILTDGSWYIDVIGKTGNMMKEMMQAAGETEEAELFKNLDIRVDAGESRNPVFPNVMSPGESREFDPVKIKVKIAFISVTVEIRYERYECTGTESVTVPAGTFETYIVEQQVLVKQKSLLGGDKQREYERTWYAPGIGEVKTQSLDKNGIMVEETVLNAITFTGKTERRQ